MTLQVSTLTELKTALSLAKSGETIFLAGGDYGKLSLSAVDFPAGVTIASADPADPAVFSGLYLKDVHNLAIDGVTFDYEFAAGSKVEVRSCQIMSSSNIEIRNSTFDGDLASGVSATADGFGAGIALSVQDSNGIVIANNAVENYYRGFVFDNITDLAVTGNDLAGMASDGMDFVDVQRVLIEGNFLHDFLRSPDSGAHPDMIQFWTNGTNEASGDITIRGNRLDIGEGSWTQSIFMRNEMVDSYGAGPEMYYYNVLIEDNVIVNGHLHGITVGETDGLTIRNNTVVHADGNLIDGIDAGVEIPAIKVARRSVDVVISDNITSAVNGYTDQADWTLSNNILVQDTNPAGENYYGDLFVHSTTSVNDGIHEFRAILNGVIEQSGAGATETRDTVPNQLTAQFDATPVGPLQATWIFDASVALNGHSDFPEGTRFLWTFGDGTGAAGQIVSHTYARPGRHDTQLTIVLPDGTTDTAFMRATVDDRILLDMTLGTGFSTFDLGLETVVKMAAVTSQGLSIAATGVAATLGSGSVVDLIGADSFGIDLSLKAASAASKGEVFRIHGSLVGSITDSGEFYLLVTTTEGNLKLTTSGAGLDDTRVHDIRVEYANDRLSVTVDGEVLAETAMDAPLAGGRQGLTFGNPWNKPNFVGVVTDFTVDFGPESLPATPSSEVIDASYDGSVDPQSLIVVDEPLPTPTPVPPEEPVEAVLDPGDSYALDLGSSGTVATIDRSSLSGLFGNDSFSIDLGLRAESLVSKGEVFRIHGSLITSVNSSGEISLQAWTTKGEVRLTTKDANLNDMTNHDIGISLLDDMLSITVDGEVLASTEMAGTLVRNGWHDLTFGNPWGKLNFDGELSDFGVSFPNPDNPAAPWTSVGLDWDAIAADDALSSYLVSNDGAASGPSLEVYAKPIIERDLIQMDCFGFLLDPDASALRA